MKTVTTISIDIDLLIEARKRHLNLSSFVNNTLKDYLGIEDKEIEKSEDIDKEINKLQLKIKSLEDKKIKLLKKEQKEIVEEIFKDGN